MGVMHRRVFRTLFFCLALVGLGCASSPAPDQNALDPYVSVWAQLNPGVFQTADPPGSLLGEFRVAAKTRDDQAARNSWRRFINEFDPEDGFFEDGMHARLVDWAKMELVRLDHRASGDADAERAQIAVMRRKAELE